MANILSRNTILLILLGICSPILIVQFQNHLPIYKLAILLKDYLPVHAYYALYVATIISSLVLLTVNKYVLKIPGLMPGLALGVFPCVYFAIPDVFIILEHWQVLIAPHRFFYMLVFVVLCPLAFNLFIKSKINSSSPHT